MTLSGAFTVYSVLVESNGTIDGSSTPVNLRGLALSTWAACIEASSSSLTVNGPVSMDSSVTFTTAPGGGIVFEGQGLNQWLRSPVDPGPWTWPTVR
jgi:hypothetical protein